MSIPDIFLEIYYWGVKFLINFQNDKFSKIYFNIFGVAGPGISGPLAGRGAPGIYR